VEKPFLLALQCTWVSDFRQTEIPTAEPLLPEPSAFEIDMAIEMPKRHISPGTDRIPAEQIQAGVEQFVLVNSIWYQEELPKEWKESIILSIYKKGDKTDCSNYRGISLLSNTYKILSNLLL